MHNIDIFEILNVRFYIHFITCLFYFYIDIRKADNEGYHD